VSEIEAARAALERGKNVVVVVPPAAECAGVVWDLLREPAVIVCADPAAAAEWAAAAPAAHPVHPVTGLARSTRLLKEGAAPIIAGAPKDLSALLSRAALKLGAAATLVLAWPETLPEPDSAALDTLLAEAGEARRVILTWNPRGIEALLERHAHRAPVVGTPPVDEEGRAARPVGPARYVVTATGRRDAAARAVLDALDPRHPYVWNGGPVAVPDTCDAVVATRLPTREEFAGLGQTATPVLLVTAAQLPYARALAEPCAPLRVANAADRAQDRAESLRAELGALIGETDLDGELALLAPLFDEFEPAEVAAALLARSRGPEPAGDAPAAPAAPGDARWTKIFVNVGKKDGVGAKDLVGALIREVKVDKADIGKIETRETFSTVLLAARAADRAVRGLSGISIRGRRVTARPDKFAAAEGNARATSR